MYNVHILMMIMKRKLVFRLSPFLIEITTNYRWIFINMCIHVKEMKNNNRFWICKWEDRVRGVVIIIDLECSDSSTFGYMVYSAELNTVDSSKALPHPPFCFGKLFKWNSQLTDLIWPFDKYVLTHLPFNNNNNKNEPHTWTNTPKRKY